MDFGDLIDRITNLERQQLFNGVFDGVVVDNLDPENKNRVKAKVEMAIGTYETDWATPVIPYAGNGYGLSMVPEIGDKVLIMFQGGNENAPIYLGSYWGGAEAIPEEASSTVVKTIKTKSGHKVILNDDEESGILRVEHRNGLCVEIDENGIYLGTENGEFEPVILGETLKNLLNDILSWLQTHSHPMSSPPAQAPQVSQFIQRLESILSQKVHTE